MKAHESKEKQDLFLELRAIRGMSLDSISREIEISKSTAISWDKEFRDAMEAMKSAQIRLFIDTYELGLVERLKEHRELSESLRNELKERDLTQIQTDKLISLYLESTKRIESLIERNHLEKLRLNGGSAEDTAFAEILRMIDGNEVL